MDKMEQHCPSLLVYKFSRRLTCSMLKNALAAVPADTLTFARRVSSAFAADSGVMSIASLLDTNVLCRARGPWRPGDGASPSAPAAPSSVRSPLFSVAAPTGCCSHFLRRTKSACVNLSRMTQVSPVPDISKQWVNLAHSLPISRSLQTCHEQDRKIVWHS